MGVNGAGKSSTFKALTGEANYQHGDVQINKYRVHRQFNKVRKYFGYCPQINNLIPDMNVREHLEFHAVLKNIVKSKRKSLIDKLMTEMDLTEYTKVRSKALSEGNKRKLCVAIAILGNPPIILLDEPSTGLDPKAKRSMWNIISRISTKRKQSAVLLSTHSMEEAEALSTKIGIMVKGQFKCYGNSQHLKNKFSSGYDLEFKIKEPSEEQVIQTLANLGMQLDSKVAKDNLGEVLQKYGAQVGVNCEGLCSDIYKTVRMISNSSSLIKDSSTQANSTCGHLWSTMECCCSRTWSSCTQRSRSLTASSPSSSSIFVPTAKSSL